MQSPTKRRTLSDDQREQLHSWFPGIDEAVWHSHVVMLEKLAHAASLEQPPFDDFRGINISSDCGDMLVLVQKGFRQVANHWELVWYEGEIGEWQSARIGEHYRLLVTTNLGEPIGFWIGAVFAQTRPEHVVMQLASLTIGLVVMIIGWFAADGIGFQRSGAIGTVAAAFSAYHSLENHYRKARNSIARGYWLATGRFSRIVDFLEMALLFAGTVTWAYGDLLRTWFRAQM